MTQDLSNSLDSFNPVFVSTNWYIHVDASSINSGHSRKKEDRTKTEAILETYIQDAGGTGGLAYEFSKLGNDDVSIRCIGWDEESVKTFLAKLNAVLPKCTEYYEMAYGQEGMHNASACLFGEEDEGIVIASEPLSNTIV